MRQRTWLITGVAGFIGSNLLEALLKAGQRVRGLDNLATGSMRNLEQVRALVDEKNWRQFEFINGDIRDPDTCRKACAGADIVLHQAALASVPRSLAQPAQTMDVNINGSLHLMLASRDAGVSRFVYASSSSVYGDNNTLPKVEPQIGKPLSPYAASKLIDEILADVFSRSFGLSTIGLRYFNVFGPRQDPEGAYAAVIPKWIASMLRGEAVRINGDGNTSRDFCYVANVVQANLLAATTENKEALNRSYNVAVGQRTTLNYLFPLLRNELLALRPSHEIKNPAFDPFRVGDIAHSHADISLATQMLGYTPTHDITAGIHEAFPWYLANNHEQEQRRAHSAAPAC